MSEDSSLVSYDLTNGVDFKHPRKTAEAFAQVFFETDAVKWFTITDNDVDFNPSYRALILVNEEDNRNVDKTMKDFMKDVEFDEISEKYLKEIEAKSRHHTGIGFAFSPFMLVSMFQNQNISDDTLIIEVLDDIKKNTEIRDVVSHK